MVDDLVKGNHSLVQSAYISTANYKTSRPITRLYPLEIVSSADNTLTTETGDNSLTTESAQNILPRVNAEQQYSTDYRSDNPRSKRKAVTRAMKRISEWTNTLRCPWEEM